MQVPVRPDDNEIFVREWLRQWLAEYVGRDYSVTTHERYVDLAERLVIPQIGETGLRDLSPPHIRDLETISCAAAFQPAQWGLSIRCFPALAGRRSAWVRSITTP